MSDPRRKSSASKDSPHSGRGVLIGGALVLACLLGAAALLHFRAAAVPEVPPPALVAVPKVDPALTIVVQPELSVSGGQLTPAPTVVVTDEQGRPVAGAIVSVSVEPGAFEQGSIDEAKTDAEGRAVFDSLLLSKAGAYRLAFSAAGYGASRSAEFVVRFGIPRVLTLVREPHGGVVGAPVPGEPTVRVTDNSGNPVPGVNVDAFLEAPGSDRILATVPTDVEGLAVFPDIIIPTPGTDYRLRFDSRAAGVNDVMSSPFSLTNS
jgi:5-hydroxyisourate hydrolase-like protein (transthyretin family)